MIKHELKIEKSSTALGICSFEEFAKILKKYSYVALEEYT